MSIPDGNPRVNRVDMKRLDPVDPALELMYFGLRGMTRDADALLARHELGRAHHRILFVIARHDGISVGQLCETLGISAQALHRPMKQLQDKDFVAASRDPARHRFKALHLTESGQALEHDCSEAERVVMRTAFAQCGDAAAKHWARVMELVARHA